LLTLLASIAHLKSSSTERERHQDDHVARLRFHRAGIAHLDNPGHIAPVMVREPVM
jgi:5-aminolevulinate synthase